MGVYVLQYVFTTSLSLLNEPGAARFALIDFSIDPAVRIMQLPLPVGLSASHKDTFMTFICFSVLLPFVLVFLPPPLFLIFHYFFTSFWFFSSSTSIFVSGEILQRAKRFITI